MAEIKPKHLDEVTLSGDIPREWLESKVASGDLKPYWLEQDLTKVCDPGLSNDDYPCPHALWEEQVRTEAWTELGRQQALAWKTDEQKLHDEERQHQSKILEGILKTVQALASKMAKDK
jgi:hypothetical protein